MKPDWIVYEPVPAPSLWKNLRWGRVARLPAAGLQKFVKWLTSSTEELSPARVVEYVNCPKKYEFVHKDRRETRAGPQLSFYSALHKTVLAFLQRLKYAPLASVDDLLRVYQENWDDAGFKDDEEERRYYADGVSALERFFEANKGAKPPDIVRARVNVAVDGVAVKATFDAIRKQGDDWTVVVYKTGRRILEGSPLRNDLKSQLLYLMLKRRWPKARIRFFYDYLVAGRRIEVSYSDEELAGTRSDLRAAARGIGESRFPPKPSSLCGWCDFQAECPQWNGYVTDRARFRFSYSKMMTYVRCPRNFKFLYVDHVAPQPRNFFSIGTSLHNAMEAFYEYDGLLKQPSFDHLVKLLVRKWETAGYRDEADEKAHFEDGLKMLRDYYLMEIDGRFKKAWACEPFFELPVGDKYVMIGFIDRIDRHDDGTYEVIDYKTEPKIRTQEEVDEDLQLTIYYWACRQAYGITPDKLTLHFTRHNKKVTTRRTEADLQKLFDTVKEVGEQVTSDVQRFESVVAVDRPRMADDIFKPKLNKYCSSCDHLHGCPKEPEVLQMVREGKTMHTIEAKDKTGPAAEHVREAADTGLDTWADEGGAGTDEAEEARLA